MKRSPRASLGVLAVAAIGLAGATSACEDDGTGVDDDVEQDVESGIDDVQDDIGDGVSQIEEEIDGEPDQDPTGG